MHDPRPFPVSPPPRVGLRLIDPPTRDATHLGETGTAVLLAVLSSLRKHQLSSECFSSFTWSRSKTRAADELPLPGEASFSDFKSFVFVVPTFCFDANK